MASFRKIRSILLRSFDNGDISEDKLLLYDVNTFKNADVPYESYGKFDLNDMHDSQCLSDFCFHKSDLLVLPEALSLCIFLFNPLTPMSDQDRTSPNNIITTSCRQVMRINTNINQGIIS